MFLLIIVQIKDIYPQDFYCPVARQKTDTNAKALVSVFNFPDLVNYNLTSGQPNPAC